MRPKLVSSPSNDTPFTSANLGFLTNFGGFQENNIGLANGLKYPHLKIIPKIVVWDLYKAWKYTATFNLDLWVPRNVFH
jgi:hypothetical protein